MHNGLGKVCFPTLCNTHIYAWGQERDWLGGEKGLDMHQGLIRIDPVSERFFLTGKKELYLAVFFDSREIAREFSGSD